MNRIGFDIPENVDRDEVEVGFAEESHSEHWSDGFGEFVFEALVKFCMVYGFFAGFRDMLRSFF